MSGQAVYATWAQRAGAVLLDIALCLPLFIVGILLAQVGNGFFAFLGALCYLAGIAAYYYFAYLNGANGRSPGKAIVGLRTVDFNTGQHLGGGKGILRYLIAGVISAFTCGFGALADYLWPLFDDKLQTLHDKAIGSVVLNTGDPQPFSQDLFVPQSAQTPRS